MAEGEKGVRPLFPGKRGLTPFSPATGARWVAAATLVLGLAPIHATTTPDARDTFRAHRIISLAPHVTELLYAAGAGNRLLATVDSSDYPPEARMLPRVGDGVTLSAEAMLALRPDLVIVWQPNSTNSALHAPLQAAGVPLRFVQPRRLDDLPAAIERLGRATDAADAPAAAQALTDRIAALRQQYADAPSATVFIDLGGEPLRTIGNDPLLNDALAVCKLRNLYADASIASPTVAMEALLANQPDALIVASSNADASRQRLAGWRQWPLAAVENNRIVTVAPDLLFRPGPRLVDAVAQLCGQLAR